MSPTVDEGRAASGSEDRGKSSISSASKDGTSSGGFVCCRDFPATHEIILELQALFEAIVEEIRILPAN
ncbi:hypothetical protein [Haladaptatus pallidirubidus]|uniref:hypothetical protein n=1 Tax=Haladaptatus pallidirubidus TaxID=1008152 RepID=UPI001D126E57|nr:hypothetical protein [Haladaptatus pallidirubidus]